MAIDAGRVSDKVSALDARGIDCGSVHCRTGTEQQTCQAQSAEDGESLSPPLVHWEFSYV